MKGPTCSTSTSDGNLRPAIDSDVTDDDIIMRYDGEEVIGITILHTSQR